MSAEELEAPNAVAAEDLGDLGCLHRAEVTVAPAPVEPERWYTTEAEAKLEARLTAAEAELAEARAAPDAARYAAAVALARAADHFAETGERGRAWNEALITWRAVRRSG